MTHAGPSSDLAGLVAPGSGHPWRLVALLAAICFLGHFNRVGMAVAGDLRIMPQYGITPTQMGSVYSAFLTFYTLSMIPGGWFIDRYGPRFALAVVCLGSAVFMLLTGMVGVLVVSASVALTALVWIRGLMGAVSSPLHPAAANAVALGVHPRRRSAANGIVTGAALLGVAATYVVLGGLIEWIGWTRAFVVAAAATGALGLLWLRYARGIARPAGAADAEGAGVHAAAARGDAGETALAAAVAVGFVRRNKSLLLLTLSYAAVGYFQYLFFYWMHYYFETVLALGSQQSKYYAAYPPLAMALGMPIGGWLSDRMQAAFGWRAARAGLAMVVMSASAALLALGIRATEPVWIVVWLSLALGVLGMVEGPFWVTAVEVGGHRGGLSAGIFNTGGNAGGILAPIVTPWVSDALGYGWQAGIGMGSLICLIGAVLWYWIEPAAARDRGAA
jgi:sugar phosphate permease